MVFFFCLDAMAQTGTEPGRKWVLQADKGNCIACHALPNEPLANGLKPAIGAPLEAIAQRYPEISVLRNIIFDASITNPDTIMPPYGKHLILSDVEIDAVVTYLRTQ